MPARMLGTPDYMAPECTTGTPVTGAADVYAVAVMSYEMLSGQLPFRGETVLQVVMRHGVETPPPMPDVPEPLQAPVLEALDKDPAQRPTAGQFAERLTQALDIVCRISEIPTEP
jgi:serine/threonine-protein kinase